MTDEANSGVLTTSFLQLYPNALFTSTNASTERVLNMSAAAAVGVQMAPVADNNTLECHKMSKRTLLAQGLSSQYWCDFDWYSSPNADRPPPPR